MKKVLKNVKVLLEESRGMGVVQTKDPQTVEREQIFSGKIQFELQVYQAPTYETIAITKSFAFIIFKLIKSYDIQILDKEI